MLRQGRLLKGRYTILQELGQGGMGAVYKARDETFGTPIALKEILFETSDDKRRAYLTTAFEREAKSLATARHDCVPFVRDYFQEGNCEYLVMELVEGDDLSVLLEKGKKAFPIDQSVDWLGQLLDTLDYLHNLSPPIIHRDIKPQNLKVTARNRLKLLDFGIAKSGDRSAVTTRKQTSIGATLSYSPIEQILRVIDATFREYIVLKHEVLANVILAQNTDARADIFSAGATFYHLLTNREPEDATKRTLDVWEGKPDPLMHASDVNAAIPRPLGDLLLKAMAIGRENRFASAIEMLEALNGVVRERNESVEPAKSVTATEARKAGLLDGVVPSLIDQPVLQPVKASITEAGKAKPEHSHEAKSPVGVPGERPTGTDHTSGRTRTPSHMGTTIKPACVTESSTSDDSFALPYLTNMQPTGGSQSYWIATVSVCGLMLAFVGIGVGWLGGFGIETETLPVNKPPGVVAPATESPLPTPINNTSTNKKRGTTKNEVLKRAPTKVKTPATVGRPVREPEQKQDPNCVFTNSCK